MFLFGFLCAFFFSFLFSFSFLFLFYLLGNVFHAFHFIFHFVGLQLCREVERQSLANLHILGSKMTGCAQTAVYRLSDVKEGNAKASSAKYRLDRQTDRHTDR